MLSATIDHPESARHKRRRKQKCAETNRDQPDTRAASYARYSSDNQREESITDQERQCAELAERNGHQILPDLQFSDQAVSGTKSQRKGLDALLSAAEAGEFDVLYVHCLSRLARESVITMPILKRLVHVHNVRFISVTEGIDSERDGWEVITTVLSLMHERFIKDLSANVFRGQEGTVLDEENGYSVGDWCFGYGSEPVLGTETTRRSRNSKPRMRYTIDWNTASWVQRIFHWFVEEKRSIRWIVRELNKRGAPKDHRSSSPEWHHQLVVNVLTREKYIGIWPWGEKQNVRDPETGKVRQEFRPEEETEKWTRHFSHLRLIDDEIFAKAQQRLEANAETWANHRNEKGQLKGSHSGSRGRSGKRLLSGLVRCKACGSPFQSMGKRMKCRGHSRTTCGVKTTLPTELAERLMLDLIGQKILNSAECFEEVFHLLKKYHQQFQNRVPAAVVEKQQQLAQIEKKIQRLVDCIEEGEAPAEFTERLAERRRQRSELNRELKKLRDEMQCDAGEPTEKWLRKQLEQLGTVLQGDSAAANEALSKIIDGGILVEKVKHPHRKRTFLRGTFSLSIVGVCAAVGAGSIESSPPTDVELVTIDFCDDSEADQQRELAKQLYDQGLMNTEIGQHLGIGKSRVTALLKEWFEMHGEEMPDGRSRRADLEKKHTEPPLYQAIADDVMELYERGMLLRKIAEELDVNPATVTSAIRFWHESRGLPVLDGRTRRKSLSKKSS